MLRSFLNKRFFGSFLFASLAISIGCKEDSPPNVSNDAFAPAACMCWELLDVGDVYFVDEEACHREAEAFFFAFAFTSSSCALPILSEREPDRAKCFAEAAEAAITCLEAIDECTLENEGAYTECLLAGWDECGDWSDGTYSAVYNNCASG